MCYIVLVLSLLAATREVNSLLVLVTTPKHSNSTHDPARYIDQLMYIADRAKYQKLLSWEPLFQLESISFEKNEYHKGDVISVRLRFDYKGPKVNVVGSHDCHMIVT